MYLGVVTKPARTVGLELAWGRIPTEVPCIFLHFKSFVFIFCFYLLVFKKI
jgi:hypothetical protein